MNSATSPNLVLSAAICNTRNDTGRQASQSMEPFSLQVSNNAVITGLRTPAAAKPPPKDTPLIVALHGGSYSADYYNATPVNSASPYSTFLGVPFIAINRPGCKDSTDLPNPLPKGRTFLQVEGTYLHNEIPPRSEKPMLPTIE